MQPIISVGEGVGKRMLLHCWWDYKLVQPLWKTVCRFLKKLKMKLPYGTALQILGIYSKKIKTVFEKNICNPCVHCSIIYNSRDMKVTIDEWIKMWNTNTMEY